MITFTEKGAEKVQEFLASQSADVQTSGLRVGVRGGGCSGFQYALAFDSERDGDEVFRTTACASSSTTRRCPTSRARSSTTSSRMQGAGFKVDNPNVIAACGCGSSFRVEGRARVSAV